MPEKLSVLDRLPEMQYEEIRKKTQPGSQWWSHRWVEGLCVRCELERETAMPGGTVLLTEYKGCPPFLPQIEAWEERHAEVFDERQQRWLQLARDGDHDKLAKEIGEPCCFYHGAKGSGRSYFLRALAAAYDRENS